MRTAMRDVAGRVAGVLRELNEAQRWAMVRRTAIDRYVANPGAAPDTYAEFMFRTSGVLVHEAPARKRVRKAQRV